MTKSFGLSSIFKANLRRIVAALLTNLLLKECDTARSIGQVITTQNCKIYCSNRACHIVRSAKFAVKMSTKKPLLNAQFGSGSKRRIAPSSTLEMLLNSRYALPEFTLQPYMTKTSYLAPARASMLDIINLG
jgi:hypothetical protein